MHEPLRILIVEDEAVLMMQLETIFEDEGHLVVGTAMSSNEAIEVARQPSPISRLSTFICSTGRPA